jgi:hypothetical protein
MVEAIRTPRADFIVARSLAGLAARAASRGEYAEAARLLGDAERAHRAASKPGRMPWKGTPLPMREEWFARMREALASGV